MSETLKPALSDEEWAKQEVVRGERQSFVAGIHSDGTLIVARYAALSPKFTTATPINEPDERHAVAALALYGIPQGFTHEDLATLRILLDKADVDDAGPAGEGWQSDKLFAALRAGRSLAARIAALLPPAVDG